MAECPVSSSFAQAATTTLYTLPCTMGVLTSYYTYGFPTFVAIVVGLYLLFTGERIPCRCLLKHQLTDNLYQAPVRRSTSAASWKRRARMRGRRRALVSVLVSAFWAPDGACVVSDSLPLS